MKTLLVTGPIGSGKSLAARVLADCGMPVYDSDAQAKKLYARHPELIAQMEAALGQNLRQDASQDAADSEDCAGLDKKKLARILFDSPEARRKVNALVHPLVIADFQQWALAQKGPWAGMESALLLSPEAGARLDCDAVLYVDAPLDVRLERVIRRDACSREQALARIRSQQLSPEDPRVTQVLVNDGDAAAFEKQVKDYYTSLLDQ